jgi:hypothetical protein
MAVTLSRKAFDHAKELIVEGKFVFGGRNAWSKHQPSAQEENEFLRGCGVLTAESREGQYKHYDIENAAAHLHGMIDARKDVAPPKRADSPGRMTRAARHSTR